MISGKRVIAAMLTALMAVTFTANTAVSVYATPVIIPVGSGFRLFQYIGTLWVNTADREYAVNDEHYHQHYDIPTASDIQRHQRYHNCRERRHERTACYFSDFLATSVSNFVWYHI